MICLVVVNMEVSAFNWTPPFFTPLQLFGNPELLSYNAALTPPCVKQGWGPPLQSSEYVSERCFTGHLSLGIRRKHCYCFLSEPPSSSRLTTIVSTSDCQVRLPWSKEETTLQPRASLSPPALGDFREAPNTSSQQHAMIHGEVQPRLTCLQLPLAMSRVSHPNGWRILLAR